MPKKILLIESDDAFARELSAALEARGLEARVTADGKEGVDLARAERPDAIVLCVELPRMSGYSVCNKLKKDDALRSIPLVIISAEATPETFEQHRKLKTHADDYLLKPFGGAELLKKLGGLVELPPAEAGDAGDDLVTLDDVEELEAAGAAPRRDGAAAPAASAAAEIDDDLKLLDDAFNSLASADATAMTPLDGALPAARPPAPVAAAPEPLPEDDDLGLTLEVEPEALEAPAELDRLGDEADAALAALGAEDAGGLDLPDPIAFLDAEPPPPGGDDLLLGGGLELAPPPPPARAAPPAFAAAAPAPLAPPAEPAPRRERSGTLERELVAQRSALQEHPERAAGAAAGRDAAEARARAAEAAAAEASDRALRELEARRTQEAARAEAQERAARAEARAAEAEAGTRGAAARAEAAERQAAELRRELEAARHESTRARGEAAAARERAEELARDLEEAQARAAGHERTLSELQPELEAARSELAEAAGTAASARADLERTLREREKRVAELEAQNAKHEERVVKAYQKIKGDEKIREKARKALAIAQQLLEERTAPAAGSAAVVEVQPRRE